MDRPSKIFICGIIGASVIVAIGFANSYYLESKLKKLVAECESMNPTSTVTFEGVTYELRQDCAEVIDSPRDVPGIQGDIIKVKRKLREHKDWPYLAATAVFVFSGIPWGWYFLLRRIRELRDEIAGE